MQSFLKKSFGFFQKLSKVLMIPFTFLPVAAILLGLSYWLSSYQNIANILNLAGSTIISLLPLIFIVAITYNFNKDKDVTVVIVGLIAYIIFVLASNNFFNVDFSSHLLAILLAFLVNFLYSNFKKIRMPSFLAFFEGKIFAVILTILTVFTLAFPVGFIFKYLNALIIKIGLQLATHKIISPFIFGVTSRLLIPTGLHHIWHNLFWFDTLGVNAMPNYLLGIGNTNYLAGFYLIMVFALPAAGIAMIHTARPENKKRVRVLMTSAILSSMLFGITEPLEFSFLLVSPLLLIFHAIMTGIALVLLNLFNIIIGFSFSAGLFDFLIILKNPVNDLSSLIYLIPLGLIYALIYYFVFRILINKLNLATPGRSEKNIDEPKDNNIIAKKMLAGLGGKDNIVSLDYCATRLRLVVKDNHLINETILKDNGALSVLQAGENIQVVIGPQVSRLASLIDKKFIKTKFKMPMDGIYQDISKTPDEMFQAGLLGPGFVISPVNGNVYSPINGKISMIYPTKHAIGISSKKGFDILIHYGLETVDLKGEGFEVLVNVGDDVKIGDLIMKVDLDLLLMKQIETMSPVVFLQKENITILKQKDNVFTIEVS